MSYVDMTNFIHNCTLLNSLNSSVIGNFSKCGLNDKIYEGNSSSTSIHPLVHWSMQIFYGLIFFGGICGNVLVIHVVTKYSRMQTVTNLYILNLAVADFLYLMGLPFLLVTSHIGNWIFGNFMCKFYMVITSLNQFTSSFFLSIMSADRYIAVCHPISAQKYRTSLISKITALTAWAAASLMVVPVFLYSTTFQVEDQIHCNIYWSSTSSIDGQTLFTVYSLILSFVLPFLLIFTFYGLVINKMIKIKTKSNSIERRKSQRKVTRLVLVLIIVYAICYLPYWMLQVSLFFVPPMKSHSSFVISLFLFSSCLSYSSSALNPVLYAFLSDNFKKSFRRVCHCTPKLKDLLPHKRSTRRRMKRRPGNPKQSSSKYLGTVTEETKGNLTVRSWDPNFFNDVCQQGRRNSFKNSVTVAMRSHLHKRTETLRSSPEKHYRNPDLYVSRDDASPKMYKSTRI